MSLLNLLLYSCATWYISYVITMQDGPFGLLLRVRNIKVLSGVTSCIYCTAPYVALVMLILYRQGGTVATGVVEVFGIAGLALMLRSYTGVGMNGI